MGRISTRLKRRLGGCTGYMRRYFKGTVEKKHGMKTFHTRERALEYAKEQKIENPLVVPAKKGKKWKIARDELHAWHIR